MDGQKRDDQGRLEIKTKKIVMIAIIMIIITVMIAASRRLISPYPPFKEACLWEGVEGWQGEGGRILSSIATVCIIDWKLAFLFIFPCVHSAWKNNTPCISDQARPAAVAPPPHPTPLFSFFCAVYYLTI